jgi:hypothetical protein
MYLKMALLSREQMCARMTARLCCAQSSRLLQVCSVVDNCLCLPLHALSVRLIADQNARMR